MSALEVEGFSAEDPIENDDEWVEQVRDRVNYWWSEHKYHDRNGWYAELAGSAECQALGHPAIDGEDDDAVLEHEKYDHSPSFDGDWLCGATRYGTACSECEGECHLGDWPDASRLWAAVAA